MRKYNIIIITHRVIKIVNILIQTKNILVFKYKYIGVVYFSLSELIRKI